jgi:23S rRNA (uracil1939-C5)-methyltransferase
MEQILLRGDGQGNWLLSLFGRPNRAKLLKRILSEVPAGQKPFPGCKGLLFNGLPVWGRDYLVLKVAGKSYRVGPTSFFQANLAVALATVEMVTAWVQDGPQTLLADLYAGVGLFSLALASHFERVVAVEADPSAVRDARNNVQRDAEARGKVTVWASEMEKFLEAGWTARDSEQTQPAAPAPADRISISSQEWRQAVCLVDPPRVGLGPKVAAGLLKLAPQHLLYLSCDPATQARDCAILVKAGYSLQKLHVLDMFPQTAHVETLLHLTRS